MMLTTLPYWPRIKPATVVVAAVALGLTLAACAMSSANSATAEQPTNAGLESCTPHSTASVEPAASAEPADQLTPPKPAIVEEVPGSQLKRVKLTPRAVERLDIKTTKVSTQIVGNKSRLTIPYAAVIYDAAGNTWVYTMRELRTYVREPVTVEDVSTDLGILSVGPPLGTVVVSEGAAMLYGTELGVGE